MDKNLRPYLAELIGTIALVFLSAGAVVADQIAAVSGSKLAGVAAFEVKEGEASPAAHDTRLYCGCADGSLSCFSTAGKKIGGVLVGAQMRAAPVPTGNGALFGAEDGSLYFSDAIREVLPLYQTEPGTRVSCPLAVSGRRVVMSATNGTVYAVDVTLE